MANIKVTLPTSLGCQHVELEMTHGSLTQKRIVLLSSLTEGQSESMIFNALLMNLKTFCVLSGITNIAKLKVAVEAKEFKI